MSTIPEVGARVERVCFLGRVRPERLAEYGLPPDQGFKRVDEIFHVD
jgi:hypothetical protein